MSSPRGLSRISSLRSPTTLLLLTWGLSLSMLAVADGSPATRLVRFAVLALATGIGIWLSRRAPGPASWMLSVYGTAGLIFGGGIGLGYLRSDSFQWQMLVGLVALAVGIAMVGMGARRLANGLGLVGSVGTYVALFLLVAVVVWTAVPAVLATNVPPIERGAETPADHGLEARDVTFTTSDGVELGAWYVPSSNGAVVVLRHGAGSTATSVLGHAAVLAEHGYGVLVTDARGHGQSGGRAMDFGWYGDLDTAAAVSFLVAQPEVDDNRVAVVGLSMGGEEAIGAAAADPRIAAVVAEGATARTDADKSWYADEYGFRGRVQMALEWLQYSLTDLLTDGSKPVALSMAARRAPSTPILLIAAGRLSEEVHAAEYIREESPGNVTVWVVPGSGHTGGLATAPTEWETTVLDFLDGVLMKP